MKPSIQLKKAIPLFLVTLKIHTVFTVLAFITSVNAQQSSPNILIILADDLGYGDVSFNGCPDYATPNIDSIARNGALCKNGYVMYPLCSPSRAALMTGRYEQRFGFERQLLPAVGNPRLGLPNSEVTLAELLRPAGYACGAIGKWHLGSAPNLVPTSRGFDEYFGFLGADSPYYNADLYRNTRRITESRYLTEAFTREAVSFINRHQAQPFFLYLAYNAVHSPYDRPPQQYMDRVQNIPDPARRIYAAMVLALDDGIGQVLQTLQADNLLNNTLIFFLSDNGAPDHGFTRNLPLRGYKTDVLEGGIHIPFAVQWTGTVPANLVYEKPIASLDIVSTAASAAGVSLPGDREYDGLNVLPFLTGQQNSPRRTLFWRHFGLGDNGPPGSTITIWAVRDGALKLVTSKATVHNPPALYDLHNDIGETTDLAAARPADVTRLRNLYDQWQTKLIAPLWQVDKHGQLAPVVLAGDWNNFNKDDDTEPWQLTRISAPAVGGTPDGYSWFVNTIHVASSGGDATPGTHSFVVIGHNSYATQWGGEAININNATVIPFFSGNELGPVNTITFDDDYYYSFRLLDFVGQAHANMELAVLKTAAPPVSITWSGQTPAVPTASQPVVVDIALSHSKSPQEHVYLRWSTDTFVTSHIVPAAGSGINYSATIPGQPPGTAVQYSLLTSTADLSSAVYSSVIDPLALSVSVNFKYVVGGSL
jgi:arylsulfatase A-like enzyme